MFGVALFLAVVGVTLYALAPGVGSYNASSLLVFPLLCVSLFWLHRWLPGWLQWTGAVLLAVAGPLGYLIFGGDQWWNWGQFAPVPLFALILTIPAKYDPRGRWTSYGGPTDGPWGPP